jgi:putative Ca2+/H+ antiporter (TMEM165/GDT1 family)
MQSLLVSIGVVAVSEIGDKTQLLALLLASRFRKPAPIILGILVATALNHTLAGLAGGWIAAAVDPTVLRWVLGALFIAMAVWTLVPDRIDPESAGRIAAGGAFLVTAVSFFLAEIGDKTQIATAALAARFATIVPVVIGTTAGMLIADVPAVIFGHVAGNRLEARWVRRVAAAIFAGLGLLALLGINIV